METLSNDLRRQILLLLSFKEIKEFCRSDSKYQEICTDDTFWRDLLIRDFSFPSGVGYLTPTIADKIELRNQLIPSVGNVMGLPNEVMSNRETYHAIDNWINRVLKFWVGYIHINDASYEIMKDLLLSTISDLSIDPEEVWEAASKFSYLDATDSTTIEDLHDEITDVADEIIEALEGFETVVKYSDESISTD